jgi:hypothetical protein
MTELTRYRSVVFDSARWEGFPFRDGDIVISTPPKCGTTWTQTLVALLVFGSADFPRKLSEISLWFDMQLASREEAVALLEAQTHRRFIKTHTALDGLPFDDRVTYICVGRDPRDVAVSCAHHMSNIDAARFIEVRERAVGLDDFAELGIELPAPGAPPPSPTSAGRLAEYLDTELNPANVNVMTLAYVVHHLKTFWDRRDDPQIALFHYADLQADLVGEMRRLADVLDIAVSDEQLATLAQAASFQAMRDNAEMVAPNADIAIWRSTADFFHRGSNGQWREMFDADALDRYMARITALATPEFSAWLHEGRLGAEAAATAPVSTTSV